MKSLLPMRILLLVSLAVALAGPSRSQAQPTSLPSPNIIVILTDDLDAHPGIMGSMTRVQALLAAQGVTFAHSFVTQPLCCPSRASLLRGQYVHNHRIYSNGPPTGGFPKAKAIGIEQSTIATLLKGAGYHTAYLGKYLNGYGFPKTTYVPPGWDEWDVLVTQDFFAFTLNENGTFVAHGPGPTIYQTDVLRDKAIGFIQNHTQTRPNQPFFLVVATKAPHNPADPAPRHAGLFAHATAPRTPNFNEADVSDKPRLVRQQPLLSTQQIAEIDFWYRQRLASLQAVDELVGQLVRTLKQTGQLNNTYLVFTSDNGYHMGQHRFFTGKTKVYEEDIHVPLIIRGPGVPQGVTRADVLVSNIDLAPTFAEIAGLNVAGIAQFDGRSLLPLWRNPSGSRAWRTAILVESLREFLTQASAEAAAVDDEPDDDPPLDDTEWGEEKDAPVQAAAGSVIARYLVLRTATYKYVQYNSGPPELYNLESDPYELTNIASSAPPAFLSQLSAWVVEYGSCAGGTCRSVDRRQPPPFPASLPATSSSGEPDVFLPLISR